MLKLSSDMRVGVDFDNTIVNYDEVFVLAARRAKLIDQSQIGGKEAVRTAVRALEGGEEKWMRLQGRVYGALMPHARIVEGFADFLAASGRAGVPVFVISHKTERGHFDEEQIDLRAAARRWMRESGVLGPLGIPEQNVFFEATRGEKIERIKSLQCSHFIDDLKEIFLEPSFPDRVERYLLNRGSGQLPTGPFKACRRWGEIRDAIFA